MDIFRLDLKIRDLVYLRQITISTVAIMLLPLIILAAKTTAAQDEAQNEKQIEIVADQFTTNNEEKYMDFTGDVRASQGDFVITAERLRIYYNADPDRTGAQTGTQESIRQIVASGDVKISAEKYSAEADRVEYDMQSMVLVLKGEKSKIKSGKNLITGSIITVNRKNEQIKVERSSEKRVRALFYPKEKTEGASPKME